MTFCRRQNSRDQKLCCWQEKDSKGRTRHNSLPWMQHLADFSNPLDRENLIEAMDLDFYIVSQVHKWLKPPWITLVGKLVEKYLCLHESEEGREISIT